MSVGEIRKYAIKSIVKHPDRAVQEVELDNGQTLELAQTWYHCMLAVGDQVTYKVNSAVGNQKVVRIDDSNGFVVLNPDHLVTITDLSSASFCERKTWLSNRFKTGPKELKAFLIGDLVHSMFQETINDKQPSKQLLFTKLKELIRKPNVLKSLLFLNLNEQEIIDESKEYIDSVLLFNQKYNSGTASPFDENHPNLKLRVKKVTDIEDSVLSPCFGLKGKVDLTMAVEIHDSRSGVISQVVTPFELKTGKVSFSMSHQAQITLYTLMLHNPSNPVRFGLLAYLKGGVSMKYITVNDYIKHSLLMQRNDLVHFLRSLDQQPKTISNVSFCAKCEHRMDCCLLAKLYDPAKLENFQRNDPDLITGALAHLTEQDLEFFRKWMDMIWLEEKSTRYGPKNGAFWSKDAIELEKKEMAIAKLVLHQVNHTAFEYVFKRASAHRSLGALPVDLQFSRNADRIALSVENESGDLEKVGFVNGNIKCIDENYVTVQLDEKLNDSYIEKVFRVDVVPAVQNYSHMYTSLLRLLNDDPNSAVLRDLIINRRKPTFRQMLTSDQLEIVKSVARGLNKPQQKAVLNTLKMDDYLLIKGNPGAGKTETIVHIVKMLAKIRRTVVITAHTNQAVDNVLLKLRKLGVDFMRIGNPSRMHPDVLAYSEDSLIENCRSTVELQKVYSSVNVFAGTCFSVNSHLVFSFRTVDYCIVDEASQISLPENLMPLFKCRKFILVGDPAQLPPIVRSPEAKKAGLEQTLFTLLMSSSNCIELTIQYRMNSEIMRVANECTYENRLTAGTPEIANATLQLEPGKLAIVNGLNDGSWLSRCLSDKLGDSVVFLDTDDRITSHETDATGEIHNPFEVNVITKLVGELTARQFPAEEIGVIAPYQRQVKALRPLARTYNVEVSTIDQYQGRDKDIILISCVKCNSNVRVESTEILNDVRRLNVATTRAKRKLILVGSRSTLQNYRPFEKLFASLKGDQYLKI